MLKLQNLIIKYNDEFQNRSHGMTMGTEMIPMNHFKHMYLYTSKDVLLVYIFEQNSFISYRQ